MFQIEDDYQLKELLNLSSNTWRTVNLVYPKITDIKFNDTNLIPSFEDIMSTVLSILLFMQTSKVYVLDTSDEYYNINRIFIDYLIDNK